MLKEILISIPFLFCLGSLLHFAYDFSKQNKIVGIFTPVNESIFEHSKLLLYPLILFWSVGYIFMKDKIAVDKYFFAMLISIAVSIVTMISFYYTYKELIGNEYMWIDIFDLLLSLFLGQIVANHVCEYSKGISFVFSLIVTAGIVLGFVYLTFKPFKTPFFLDKKSKTYGINKE